MVSGERENFNIHVLNPCANWAVEPDGSTIRAAPTYVTQPIARIEPLNQPAQCLNLPGLDFVLTLVKSQFGKFHHSSQILHKSKWFNLKCRTRVLPLMLAVPWVYVLTPAELATDVRGCHDWWFSIQMFPLTQKTGEHLITFHLSVPLVYR